ncbi:glycosyltransferase family 39 protein [Glaciihabitans sp. UYNi722]|uniref:glycosyltransferase family 39 protein n=1 Tax=Glaciihabitans sp. UYNi722 TaxID=3156344 RepID=UPI00339A51DE
MSTALVERPLSVPLRVVLGGIRLRYLAIGLGALGWFVTFLGSWIPSFWGDEAASVMSAERPISTLWSELGRVDAVHGTYYLFLHFWIDLFGASELSVRFPSTIAVGVAVAGTVVLGGLLFSRPAALIAGIVCILLPRVGYMAAEGRSYAIGTALAVWLTVLLVTLMRRRATGVLPWLGYSVLLAVSIYVFLYFVLIAVVHGMVLVLSKDGRPLIRRWLAAAVGSALLASPLLVYGLAQHGQISFLAHRNYVTFERLFVIQWFGDPWLAAACWAVILAAVVFLIRRRSAGGVLVVAWLLVPMSILFVGNSVIAPMYSIRYLSFSTPAAALLIGVGIGWLGRNWLRVAAVVALVALAIPTNLFQRTPYAKDGGSDLRQLSEVVAQNAHSGDAIVFDKSTKPSGRPRLALHLYPQDFAGLKDVGLLTPYMRLPGLWDRVAPVSEIGGALTSTPTVWAVELSNATTPADVLDLQQLGYTVSREIPVHRTTVYQLTRETP